MLPDGRIATRIKDFDYRQGAYFLTICAVGHSRLFGSNGGGGQLKLSSLGRIVGQEWTRTGKVRSEVTLHPWALMPNHFHAIVFLPDESPVTASAVTGGAHGRAPLRRSPRRLGSLVAGFKAASTTRISELRRSPGRPVWQRGYFERVIRSEEHLERVRR